MPTIDGVQVPESQVRTRVDAPTLAASKAITGATNASPIVVTAIAHGYSNGDTVLIEAVGGNTAANGWRKVKNVAANTFEITTLADVDVAGNGAYTAGGTAKKLSSSDGVISSRTVWLTKFRMANTTGGAITITLSDNSSGATTPTGPNYRYTAVSIAANSVALELQKGPDMLEEGAVFYASAAGLQVLAEGWRKPNFS